MSARNAGAAVADLGALVREREGSLLSCPSCGAVARLSCVEASEGLYVALVGCSCGYELSSSAHVAEEAVLGAVGAWNTRAPALWHRVRVGLLDEFDLLGCAFCAGVPSCDSLYAEGRWIGVVRCDACRHMVISCAGADEVGALGAAAGLWNRRFP